LKKAFLKPTASSKIFLALFLLIQLYFQPAYSATTSIDSSNINISSIGTNNIVNFIGGGSLIVDSSKTLDSLTTSSSYGNINFSTASNLSVTNSIGALGNRLNNISFNADATLILKGDAYLNSGITTTNNNTGSIKLNTDSTTILQKIESPIGSINFKLKELSIEGKGATFNKDVYVLNFNNFTNSEIDGSGNINSINATISDNLKISNSGNVNVGLVGINNDDNTTVNYGTTSIANGIALTINNTGTSLTNLDINDLGKIIINNNKNLNILGNVNGANSLINTENINKDGDPANISTLTFSGKNTQIIQASICEASTKLTNLINLNVSNVLSSAKPSISNGIALENDAYLNNIKFTNIADTSKISIASGKSINLLKNISESGGNGIITGAGTLNLEGTSIQTIDSNLGTSTTDRLGELKINNTAKITLNDSSYLTKITSLKSSSLSNNSTLNITTLDIQKSLKIGGSGDFEVANLSIANAENLTLEDDKTIKITNAITGDGAIKTNYSGTGNILFSSSSDINVANKIGESNAYLNKIILNNADGKAVNFNNDVFASGINFTNFTGQSKIAIATAKTLNIVGDVNNLSDSIISGAGTLKLSGTNNEQNIYAKIGTDATKLGTLEINNPFGVIFYQDSFVDNLNLTNGAIKIAGKTLTITNGLDLTNTSFNSKIIDNFGKIQSSTLTIADTTNIAFDYTNNNVNLDYALDQSSLLFAPAYSIIETSDTVSAQSITGDINSVKISDNSYLFDNILEKNNKIIVTKIKASDNFNSANIGAQNYALLENIMASSINLAPKFFRISNKESLNLALTSLKPISLETFINSALSANEIISNSIYSHVKNINLDKVIDPKNKNNNIEKPKNFALWGQLFGDKSMQKSNDSKQKFSTKNFGGIIGIDHLIKSKNNDIVIGSAITINKASIGDDLKIHSNDANYYQLSFYNNNFSKIYEGFYNKNLANFSFNKYKNLRNIKIENYQQIAKSNFNGKSYSFESGFGYKAKIFDNFSITPDLSLQYFKFSQNSYKERGLQDIILKVKSTNYDEFIAKLGVDFTGNFSYSEATFKPNFSISWDRKLKNNRQLMRANFVSDGGQEINNDLTILQRDKLNLGIGLNLLTNENHKFNFKYNLQLANRYLNNGGFAEYSWEF